MLYCILKHPIPVALRHKAKLRCHLHRMYCISSHLPQLEHVLPNLKKLCQRDSSRASLVHQHEIFLQDVPLIRKWRLHRRPKAPQSQWSGARHAIGIICDAEVSRRITSRQQTRRSGQPQVLEKAAFETIDGLTLARLQRASIMNRTCVSIMLSNRCRASPIARSLLASHTRFVRDGSTASVHGLRDAMLPVQCVRQCHLRQSIRIRNQFHT